MSVKVEKKQQGGSCPHPLPWYVQRLEHSNHLALESLHTLSSELFRKALFMKSSHGYETKKLVQHDMLYLYFFLFEDLKKLYKQDLINLFKAVACGNSSPLNGGWGQVKGDQRRRGDKEGG